MKTLSTIRSLAAIMFIMVASASSAQTITEERAITPFTNVSASAIFNVHLTQTDEFKLAVEAPGEYMNQVETRVKNGTLHIDYSGKDFPSETINIYVSAPGYTRLSAASASGFFSKNRVVVPELELNSTGAGKFNLEVETDLLTTRLSGASDVRLKGHATKHIIKVTGASNIRAFDLETEVTEASVTGASNVQVHAQSILEVNTTGTSRVRYTGTPAVKKFKTDGLARITSMDDGQSIGFESFNDTTIVRVGQREVVLIDGKPGKITRKKSTATFRNNWSGLELGINGYLTPGGSITLDAEDEYMDLLYNKSIAVNLNLWQQNLVLVRNQLALVTGLGVSWNNYRFSENVKLIKGEESVEPVWGEESFSKTKLTISHLNVPLLLEFQTPSGRGANSFHMSAGLNVGLRLRSHTKQVYDLDGRKQKDKDFEDFYLNPFRYDATARIGWGRVNLFGSYALNTLFKDNKGPELHPFSVGVRIINL